MIHAGLNGSVNGVKRGLALPSRLPSVSSWAVGADRPHAYVESAIRALARDGMSIRELGLTGLPQSWALAVAEELADRKCDAAIVFCSSPGLAACLANKIPGVRAVPVATIAQAATATLELGANLLAVELPGRTFFEVRQMMRVLFTSSLACPAGVAAALEEAESRAHC